MTKEEKLSKDQCPKTDFGRKEMAGMPCTSLVGSLMYAHVCTRPDIAYAISILGRFQSNHGNAHWITAKKVLRYM